MSAVKKVSGTRTKKQFKDALARAAKRGVARGTLAAHALDAGGLMVVAVQVDNNHLIPYSVSWDGAVILNGLTSASTPVKVTPGVDHVLGFTFDHGLETTFSHKLTATPQGGAEVMVDQKSSSKGDDPISVGRRVFRA